MTTTYRKIRKSGSNPAKATDSWSGLSWSAVSNTGAITVNDDTALSLTTFYAAVGMIAADVAGFPFHVYELDEKGDRQPIRTPEMYYLWGRPNPEMTRQSFWERVVGDEVRGNAYIWVEKNDIGGVQHLWYVDRRRVRVGRTTSGQKVYEVDSELPMIDYKQGGEILHIPNWGDGLAGYDIVTLAAGAIGLGLTAQEYASRTFSQGDTPPGILSTDNELTIAEADELERRWNRRRGGGKNWAKTAVLSKGVKYQQVSSDPEKMQMEQLRRYQAGDVATLVGVPPHMLGLVDRSTSWGTGIEEQEAGYNRRTLQRHSKRVEQAVTDDLLVNELTGHFLKMNMDGQLRATTLRRYQAHALGYGRWLTANEIRAMEELPAIEGGDELLAAVNMVPADQLGALMGAESSQAIAELQDRVMALSGKNGKH